MPKRNILIGGIIAALIIAAGGVYFFVNRGDAIGPLSELKAARPELAEFVDEIIKQDNKLKEDPNKAESYLTLGLAWKSLADRTLDKEHYRQALSVYERGAEKTQRKNTVMLVNAGNMAVYVEDYPQAEEYYREAIGVAPGDIDIYQKLAELYEYRMQKSKVEILAVYDQAKDRVLDAKIVELYRNDYLRRQNARENEGR